MVVYVITIKGGGVFGVCSSYELAEKAIQNNPYPEDCIIFERKLDDCL